MKSRASILTALLLALAFAPGLAAAAPLRPSASPSTSLTLRVQLRSELAPSTSSGQALTRSVSKGQALLQITDTPTSTGVVTTPLTPTATATPIASASNTPTPTPTATIAATLTPTPTATTWPTPVLISPADGATLYESNPTFQWNAVGGAAFYSIQISLASDFASLANSGTVTDTTYTASSALAPNLYYWRVGAWTGAQMMYSETRALILYAPTPSNTPTATASNTPTLNATQTATATTATAGAPTATPNLTATSLIATAITQATQAASVPTATAAPTIALPTAPNYFDVYEADNTDDTAKQIVIGESQTRSFYSAGGDDVDWAWVLLKPGTWRISAATAAGIYDPKLTLYRLGRVVATADDEDGKNAVTVVQVMQEHQDFRLMVENLGVDGPGTYNLTIEKIVYSGGGSSPAATAPSVALHLTPTPTARPPSRLIARIFIDRNSDGLMDIDEGVNQVLVLVSASKGGWQEQSFVSSGLAVFIIPPSLPKDADIFVEVPYLHRNAKFRLPDGGGDIQSDVVLPLPQYPVYLP